MENQTMRQPNDQMYKPRKFSKSNNYIYQSRDDRFVIPNNNSSIVINDNKFYKIGDIIEATIDDFSLLNDVITHYIKGKIVGIYHKDSLRGYDVKLYKPIYCERYIPNPLCFEFQNYIQPKMSENMSDLKNIFTQMDLVFINHDNITRHCSGEKISNMTFLEGLRETWSKLTFRSVKAIIKNADDLTIVEYIKIDENKKVQIETFPDLKVAFSKVPKKFHRNIRGRYSEYYGFSTSDAIRPNDLYVGKEIFFSKKCHSELKLDTEATGRFNKNDIENTWPPRKDQLICGIPEQGEKGLFFRKWFVCSRQFLLLWTMIFYPNDVSLMDSYTHKPKTFNKLLSELDTRPLQPNYEQSVSDIQERYKIFNVETHALERTDIYQNIAKLAFLQEETDKMKRLKMYRLSNASHLISKTFDENLYDNVLWMLDV